MSSTKPRRLTPKGEQTRHRIVAAAAQLMFEHGVAATTVEDVRDAAGVSNSQVYHYFTDKNALIRAVIAYQSDTVVGGQEPMFARLDTVEGFRAWRDFLVAHQRRMHCRGGCPLGSLGSELAEINSTARADVATAFRRWESGVRSGLRSMAEAGRLDPAADPDKLATTTLAALQGALLLTQLQRDTAPLEIALDTMIDHIASRTRPASDNVQESGIDIPISSR
ncbi:TetR/AcrR family transcriptional regulator [Nocardia sp. NPDC051981]|uniref:TetR/AcrR family transcriptional regulator n=1 Tax=Nocardia sp. NPDC051981 TaxID=3155417 RepID=UPI0034292668